MTETENKAILEDLLRGFSTADVGLLMPFLEAKEVAGGTVVITHGGKDADVFFLLAFYIDQLKQSSQPPLLKPEAEVELNY
ncbi:MAG: hypothetical protein ACPH4D_05690 [Porticoccaceae bacterium]